MNWKSKTSQIGEMGMTVIQNAKLGRLKELIVGSGLNASLRIIAELVLHDDVRLFEILAMPEIRQNTSRLDKGYTPYDVVYDTIVLSLSRLIASNQKPSWTSLTKVVGPVSMYILEFFTEEELKDWLSLLSELEVVRALAELMIRKDSRLNALLLDPMIDSCRNGFQLDDEVTDHDYIYATDLNELWIQIQ